MATEDDIAYSSEEEAPAQPAPVAARRTSSPRPASKLAKGDGGSSGALIAAGVAVAVLGAAAAVAAKFLRKPKPASTPRRTISSRRTPTKAGASPSSASSKRPRR